MFLVFNKISIVTILVIPIFFSCKKEKPTSPTITFLSPEKNHVFHSDSSNRIIALVHSNEDFESLEFTLHSPDQEILTHHLENPKEQRDYFIDQTFLLSGSQHKQGEYRFIVKVKSASFDQSFERRFSFLPQKISKDLTYITFSQNGQLNFVNQQGDKLYHRNLFTKIEAATWHSGNLYIASQEKGIFKITPDIRSNPKNLISNAELGEFYSFNRIGKNELQIASEVSLRYKLLMVESNEIINELNNQNYKIIYSSRIDHRIYCIEKNRTRTDDNQFAYYEKTTGGYIGSQQVPLYRFGGIFHFGGSNAIFTVGSKKGENKSFIYRYNPSANSVAFMHEVTGSISENSCIKLDNDRVLFRTTEGKVYIFRNDLAKPYQISNMPEGIILMELKEEKLAVLFQEKTSNTKFVSIYNATSFLLENTFEVDIDSYGIVGVD